MWQQVINQLTVRTETGGMGINEPMIDKVGGRWAPGGSMAEPGRLHVSCCCKIVAEFDSVAEFDKSELDPSGVRGVVDCGGGVDRSILPLRPALNPFD